MLCNKCGKAFDGEKECPFCGTRVIKIGVDNRKKEEAPKSPFVAAKVEEPKDDEAEAKAKASQNAKHKAVAEETKVTAEAEAKVEKVEAKTEAKAKAEAKTKAEAKAETEAKAEAEAKTEAEAKAETKAEIFKTEVRSEESDANAEAAFATYVKNAPEQVNPEKADDIGVVDNTADDPLSDVDDMDEDFTPVYGAFVPRGVTPKPSAPVEIVEAPSDSKVKDPKKSKLITFGIVGAASVAIIIGGVVGTNIVLKNSKYNKAMNSFNNHDYTASYDMFSELGSYKDSDFWAQYSKSEQDIQNIAGLEAEHKFAAIIEIYSNRAGFFGSTEEGIEASKLSIEYDIVRRAFENKAAKKYGMAKAEFDSLTLLREKYKEQVYICEALDCAQDEWWEDVVANLYAIQIGDYELSFLDNPKNEEEEFISAFYNDNYIDYDKIDTIAEILKPASTDQQEVYDLLLVNLKYDKATYLLNGENYESAKAIFDELGDFADSAERSAECDEMLAGMAEQYELAKSFYDNGEYYSAKAAWEACGDYKDSAEMAASCVQEMPESGSMSVSPDGPNPVYISAPSDKSLFFRVYDSDGSVVAQIFVGAGEQETLKLNQGNYIMKAAFGTEWFGEKELFGNDGIYRKILYNGSDSIPIVYPYYLKVNFSDGPSSVSGTSISDGAAGM